MNWLDIVLLVVGLSSALIGWRIGIIKLVFTLAGLGGGLFLAGRHYSGLAPSLSNLVEDPQWRSIIAFGIILIVVFLAAMIANALLRKLLSMLFLGWIDKIGGLIAMVCVGMVVMAGTLAVVQAVPILGPRAAKIVENSAIATMLVEQYDSLVGNLPRSLP